MRFSLLLLALLIGHAAADEAAFLNKTRQLTLSGKRSGEGYFSADGKKMIFQSEREPGNPFYQIYVLDLATGDTARVSPGVGKTTCGWLFPDGKKLLFSSTHADQESAAKQEAEIKERAEGPKRRYSWDYDEQYDIWQAQTDGSGLVNLTKTPGYDAEASVSPDGSWIVFASNRHAYQEKLSAADQERFDRQKSYMMDLYLMRSDGSDVKRLTDTAGYDGGPFFSADGKQICWRRFNAEETQAEIWTMRSDGSEAKAITKMGAMSWAPFFHPSGQYLIFTTNKQGFDNFELYMVDAAGTKEPVRITETAGFDGLPSFSPDGKKLAWSSGRTADKNTQIFLAEWNHAAALAALGLGTGTAPQQPQAAMLEGDISAADMRVHVEHLASPEMEGRLTGTKGEQLATSYAAQMLASFGLKPDGDNNTFFHGFDFTAGVALGPNNILTTSSPDAPAKVEQDWVPLSFSTTGKTEPGGIVFAGYGLEVPESVDGKGVKTEGYSSYVHLPVKDQWVLVFRYMPEGLSQEVRVRFNRHASLRSKAMTAREKGARGLIICSGPNSKVTEQLVPLSFDASLAGSGIPVISISDALAAQLLAGAKQAAGGLAALQTEHDKGEMMPGFSLGDVKLDVEIDIRQEKRQGRNVIARLPATQPANPPEPPLIVGAHIDHLGNRAGTDSRATEAEKGMIHFGADDNASGVAGMLEIAQYFSEQSKSGALQSKRDIIFAAWSGEELGLLGSAAWVKAKAKATGDENAILTKHFAANFNMDMIGRMQSALVLQGLGSSDYWAAAIEKRNVVVGLPLQLQNDCFVPTDATSFYMRGIPILNAFTGAHEDYHRPTDTPDKIQYDAAAQIAQLMALLARDLATTSDEPAYKEAPKPSEGGRGAMRAYLGTIPDYSQGNEEGVKLSGVSATGPAAKAGVRAGDVIVKLAGKDIKNIYEYTDVMAALKIGTEADITVKRDGKIVELKITPGSRE